MSAPTTPSSSTSHSDPDHDYVCNICIVGHISEVPPSLLSDVRRRLLRDRGLLPFEKVQFWEDASTQNAEALIVILSSPSAAIAIVGFLTHNQKLNGSNFHQGLHLVSVCSNSRPHLGILLDELSLCFRTITIDTYHQDEKEHDHWKSLNFHGVSFHRRPRGDRLRMQRTQTKRNEKSNRVQ